MSGRRLRCVLRRWRLLFLLWFVFFWLRTVRDSQERDAANQSNKYSHKFFHSGLLDLLVTLFIQRCSDVFRMPSLPQNAGCSSQPSTPQHCCRTASNNTIATAVARFRLRVPCTGIVMQLSALASSKSFGTPFVSRPNTRKSSF